MSQLVAGILSNSSAQFYASKPRVRDDILVVTTNVTSLQPTWMACNINGMQENLIVLKGTIPTRHRGATYQTPIHVIIPYNYPMSAPIVYVKPTPNMLIQTHRYVNKFDGRVVRLPYLDRWTVMGSLVEAILAVQQVFDQKPPLYAKPRGSNVTWANNHGVGAGAGAGGGFRPDVNVAGGGQRHARADSSDGLDQVKTLLVQQLSMRLKNDIQKKFQQLQKEINEEFQVHTKLAQRKEAIKNGIVGLSRQKGELESLDKQFDADLKGAKERIEAISKLEDPCDMVSPADVWSKQAFDLVASINAYDDLIFSVEDALENGVIEIDEALLRVRQVAKQQFLDKALAKKVFEAQKRRSRGSY